MAAAQTQQTSGKPLFFNASIARLVIRLTCFLTIPLSKTPGKRRLGASSRQETYFFSMRLLPRGRSQAMRTQGRFSSFQGVVTNDMNGSSENQPRRNEERTEGKSFSEPANFISITATPAPLATVSGAVQAKISYPV